MTLRFDFLTIDCHDPQTVGTFWVEALDDYVVLEDPNDAADDGELVLLPQSRRGPKLLFQKVADDKVVKNRLHFDLKPEDADPADEVVRLEALGATKVDIGQGDDVDWTVMADPEGNEFCVLR